jgi:hypothetical protein
VSPGEAERHAVAEQLADVLFGAPQCRRLGAEEPEEVAGHALGREGDQADRAAGAADADEFVRRRSVVGREDDAGRRGHHVELVVRERQRGGVGLYPLHLGRLVAAAISRGPKSQIMSLANRW